MAFHHFHHSTFHYSITHPAHPLNPIHHRSHRRSDKVYNESRDTSMLKTSHNVSTNTSKDSKNEMFYGCSAVIIIVILFCCFAYMLRK